MQSLLSTVALGLAMLATGACESAATCGAEPSANELVAPLYGASPEPGVIELTTERRGALVTVIPRLGPVGFFCSGTVIAPEWVLTAAHCNFGTGIIIGQGTQLANPAQTLASTEVHVHPTLDVALVRVANLAPTGVSPLHLRQEPVDDAWVGTVVQLAGFGEREQHALGDLQFVASHVEEVDETTLTTDGEGRVGACIGDSGGPLLAMGARGRPEILGVLSSGASSCVDRDHFLRADAMIPWVLELVGAQEDREDGCGALTAVGRCQAGKALWCLQSDPHQQRCSGDQVCGWDQNASGFRCVTREEDPCAAVGSAGRCDGEIAYYCEEGALFEIQCAVCGQVCGRDAASGRATCVDGE